MAGKLQDAIKQSKPFPTLEEEVFLSLQWSAEVLMRRLAEALKPSDLTPTQYNVLRILRGAEPDGLPCREIGERMVTHDSDVTRLLDRLESRDLVRRARGEQDRRIVFARIAAPGIELLDALDAPIQEFMVGQLGHLGREKLASLSHLLERACDAGR
jgi:DNA-binding MarR family transcriptional regulator